MVSHERLRARSADDLLAEWDVEIKAVAARFSRCRTDRDDVAQHARLALLKATATYDRTCGTPFSHYAGVAIRNAAKDFARGTKRRRVKWRDDHELVEPLSPSTPLVDHLAITEWLAALPVTLQRVHEAVYQLGHTQREAACLLGISQPRVAVLHKKLLDQGRVALASLMSA
jgi:RNA polymerase sigma factor (sigma-70 family)